LSTKLEFLIEKKYLGIILPENFHPPVCSKAHQPRGSQHIKSPKFTTWIMKFYNQKRRNEECFLLAPQKRTYNLFSVYLLCAQIPKPKRRINDIR
jgi:hypothetical protein